MGSQFWGGAGVIRDCNLEGDGNTCTHAPSSDTSHCYIQTSTPNGGLSVLQVLLAFEEFQSAPTSLVAQMVKASAHNAGDPGSIPGTGRSPGEGNGNPLQYSCLDNPMDGEAW